MDFKHLVWKIIVPAVLLAVALCSLNIGHNLAGTTPLTNVGGLDAVSKMMLMTPSPQEASITDTDNYSGVGQPLTAVECARGTNTSQQVGPFSNTSSATGSINVPPGWTGYQLFSNVTNLQDNRSWAINGSMDQQSPWQYQESPDPYGINMNGSWSNETCWGWWTATPPAGTSTGALFLHNGYDANTTMGTGNKHAISPTDYAAWNETTYVDRQVLTGVRVSFDYWANHTAYGCAQFVVQLNGYSNYLPLFQEGSPNNTWVHEEFLLSPSDMGNLFFTGPSNIKITLKIQVLLGPYSMTVHDSNGYAYQEIYLDNFSLWIAGTAKPTQLQLQLNNTAFTSGAYGTGNISLDGTWPNPSSVDFTPLIGTFTGNSTGMQLTASFTLYVNRTEQSQMQDGSLGTVFLVSNTTEVNWTTYYYAYTPYGYSNYNFSISFPTDWMPWTVLNPTASPLLSQLISGSGFISVNATYAATAGWWIFQFNSQNFVNQIHVYQNSTIGPAGWIESAQFKAGDFIQVNASIANSIPIAGTSAELDFRLPNGVLWVSRAETAVLSQDGQVQFAPVQLPATNESDYLAGTYNVFVTWNNSLSGSPSNESGIEIALIMVRHPSILIPQPPVKTGVRETDMVFFNVSFEDLYSGVAISGGNVWFENMSLSNQTMNMIAPGLYYAQTQVLHSIAGVVNLTIYGSQAFYTNATTNISLQYNLLTQLVANTPQVTVTWGDSFTFELNYTESVTAGGITGAIISTDWKGTSSFLNLGNGNYTLTCNSSVATANTVYTLLVSASEPGFVTQSLALSAFVAPRPATLASVLINGMDVTLNKSITVPVTSDLLLSATWWDSEAGKNITGANVQVRGIGGSPIDLKPVGNAYQYALNGTNPSLNIGSHYVTLSATEANYQNSTIVLEIKTRQIEVDLHTPDNATVYSLKAGIPFTLGIFVNNQDFGGTIKGGNVTYEWTQGSGSLTDSNDSGYYWSNLGNLPAGTWTFHIRVYIGPDYETKDLLVTVSIVVAGEGFPLWLLFLLGAGLATVIIAAISYVKYYRYPRIIRLIRWVRRNLARGRKVSITTRDWNSAFIATYASLGVPSTSGISLLNKSRFQESGKLEAQEKGSDQLAQDQEPGDQGPATMNEGGETE